MLSEKNNFNYIDNIHTVATIKCDTNNNKFFILLKYPVEIKEEIHEVKYRTGIDDPGIRKFGTFLLNDKVVMVGEKAKIRLKLLLKTKDKIKANQKLTKIQKDKLIELKNNKIHNLVTDMHWKLIKYLTNNLDHIIIGNFSTKDMGESKTVKKMVKRIGNAYRMYDFKQKLKYKCKYLNVKYTEADEAYTTQCCCRCGNRKKDIGSNEVYACTNCGNVIDRDVNSTINIACTTIQGC
jgi:transposase